MSWFVLFYSLLGNIAWSFILDGAITKAPVVNSECGPVEGISESAVYIFKGIPYAEPPVRNLRWKSPVPIARQSNNCWSGTYKANSFGSTCIQRGFINKSRIVGSEDCLYLNVWTPSIDKNANLPVMVWIHGGYLNYMNGNWPTYSPTAEHTKTTNMVYVSMNYRLNAFGFMALDILSNSSEKNTSGNYGFMDQILAMKWVQQNIRNFGGNPNLVTVFGQSSGGTSIYALLASPLSAGLFHRAWMMSGSPLMNKTSAEASKDNLVFLKNTGCSDINCLVSLPAADVVRAIPWDEFPYWEMTDQNDLPVVNLFDGALPVIDGYVLPKPPLEAWKNGEMIDVPVILSTTAQEIDDSPVQNDIGNWTWHTYTEKVKEKLGKFPGINVTKVLELYPVGLETPEYQYTSMVSDLRVTCPNNDVALSMQKAFKSPVHRYVSIASPRIPTGLFGMDFKAKYAAHAWDCVAYFGTIKDYYIPIASGNKTIQILRKEISHFAETGKPSTGTWVTYPNSTATIDSKLTVVNAYNHEQCSFWSASGLYSYAWIN